MSAEAKTTVFEFAPMAPESRGTQVEIVERDCLEVVQSLAADATNKVALLNMANPRAPGGDVLTGANAQEEEIFRRTNAGALLRQSGICLEYPLFARVVDDHQGDGKKSWRQRILLTEPVLLLRDRNGAFLAESDRVTFSLISASAQRFEGEEKGQIGVNMASAIKNLLEVASQAQPTHLVLSAWGCGAFHQDPKYVAELFRHEICQWANPCQVKIFFAVLNDHNSTRNNKRRFAEAFDKCAPQGFLPPAEGSCFLREKEPVVTFHGPH